MGIEHLGSGAVHVSGDSDAVWKPFRARLRVSVWCLPVVALAASSQMKVLPALGVAVLVTAVLIGALALQCRWWQLRVLPVSYEVAGGRLTAFRGGAESKSVDLNQVKDLGFTHHMNRSEMTWSWWPTWPTLSVLLEGRRVNTIFPSIMLWDTDADAALDALIDAAGVSYPQGHQPVFVGEGPQATADSAPFDGVRDTELMKSMRSCPGLLKAA